MTSKESNLPRVLVADDEPTTRILIRATLERAGFEVIEAVDGDRAWEAFQTHLPDVVLLDVRMPGVDGLTLCRRIRDTHRGATVPVVVMTDRDDNEALEEAFESGATDFLGKPLSWRLLGHRVRHIHRANLALKRVAESERRYRALVEALPDLLLRVAADGTYLDAVAPERFPLAEEAARCVGRRVDDEGPLPPEAAGVMAQCLASGETGHLEFQREIRSRRHVFEARLAPSGTGEVLVAVRDVTHEAELEHQMAVAQKLQALGVLAGGIAHELNNLLQPILGYADLVAGSLAPDSRPRRNLDKLIQAAERARDLVARVLSFSRPRARRRVPVDLAALVHEAGELVSATLPANVHVSLHLESDPGLRVLADPSTLHQVVMNLCTNAAHAIGEREGRIEIRLEGPLDPDGGRPPGLRPGPFALLSVKDTGSGIPPELQARVFEPFFTTKPPGQGTGLGLAVVHAVVTACGGAVTLQSSPGTGTEFRLYLPTPTHTPGVAPCAGPLGTAPEHAAHASGTVLFLDDEETIRELAAEALEEAGFQVLTAATVEEARRIARENRLDAAVLDQTLPDGRGTALLPDLWASHPGLPVILCTGFDPDLGPEKAAELGVSAFAWKPLRSAEIVRLVHEAMRSREDGPNG
ncbi:MAG: response regulator [Deltaproteobacteria bacterium]|nr:response regulator [Deltaproteobacteria bacterium]